MPFAQVRKNRVIPPKSSISTLKYWAEPEISDTWPDDLRGRYCKESQQAF